MSVERLPAMRVRLPCADESEFYARLADGIAENGLRIPTANPRPVGTRVKVTLEFRNGGSLPGEAVVDALVEGPRPALNVRFLRLDRGDARPPAPAGPVAPGRAPAPMPPGCDPGAVPRTPAAPAAPSAPAAARPAAAPQLGSLFDDGAPEVDPGDIEEVDASGATAFDPAAANLPELPVGPSPEVSPGPSAGPAAPRIGRRGVLIAVAVAAAVGVAGGGWVLVSRRAAPPPARAGRGAAAAHIAAADRRMSEARLVGPDCALEHLLEARKLALNDPGVATRLSLLADTLEALGSRALARGDVDEAGVHLISARDAAPDRESIRLKLKALDDARNRAGAQAERGSGGRGTAGPATNR